LKKETSNMTVLKAYYILMFHVDLLPTPICWWLDSHNIYLSCL